MDEEKFLNRLKKEHKQLLVEIKKELLEDREFREKLFKLYSEDDERFINEILKREVPNEKSDTSKN